MGRDESSRWLYTLPENANRFERSISFGVARERRPKHASSQPCDRIKLYSGSEGYGRHDDCPYEQGARYR